LHVELPHQFKMFFIVRHSLEQVVADVGVDFRLASTDDTNRPGFALPPRTIDFTEAAGQRRFRRIGMSDFHKPDLSIKREMNGAPIGDSRDGELDYALECGVVIEG